MHTAIEWIINNKEWVFSGIGGTILAIVAGVASSKRKNSIQQKQKSGDNSKNIQACGNINIKGKL